MNLNQNRIVVMAGTSMLTTEINRNNYRSFDRLACVLSDLHNRGYEVVLVSSGAEAFGWNKLNLRQTPNPYLKQAATAVGQCNILFLYDKFFSLYGKTIGQVLVTTNEIRQKNDGFNSYDNFLNAFETMLQMDVIPIVWEKETLLFKGETKDSKEDCIGLASALAQLLRAGKLVLFTDRDSKTLQSENTIDIKPAILKADDNVINDTLAFEPAHNIETIVLNSKNPSELYGFLEGTVGAYPIHSAL